MRGLDEIKPVLTGRYLVKGWLDRGAASVVYGESNVGKIFFALDVALHVAAGLPWRDSKLTGMRGTDHAGPVVYVAAEGGTGINNRNDAIRRDNPDLLKESNFILLPTGLDLCAATGGDENTAQDMGAFIQNVGLLRERTGAHVMVIHHSDKDTRKGARGSSGRLLIQRSN